MPLAFLALSTYWVLISIALIALFVYRLILMNLMNST